jgi:subtilisin family serine protease
MLESKALRAGLAVVLLIGVLAGSGPAGAAPPQPKQETSAQGPIESAGQIQVESELLAEFSSEGKAGYMVYFAAQPDLSAVEGMGWEERGQYVYAALTRAAEQAQAPARRVLDEAGVPYQSFWIDNVLLVESSDLKTFNSLRELAGIREMKGRRVLGLIEPEPAGPRADQQEGEAELSALLGIEPNLVRVQADKAWGYGITGSGIVVASIDTGVRFTHQALVNQYRGNQGGGAFNHNYSWYDPYGTYSYAYDGNGHGTHTVGTMVGSDGAANQVGMAPGAKWIACRGCSTSSCTDVALITCAQFVAAPTNLAGGAPDPSKRAHVVNNSWGDCDRSYDPWYQGVVNNWHAFGVYPVFANGNASNCDYGTPPGLNTVGNPGRYGNVTGVGSTGLNNGAYATHSNWGPTDHPDTMNPRGYPNLKPQVVAPGVSIRSTLPGSDTAYGQMTGTSMSAPHVAGLVALVWQAAPGLIGNYAATETLIEQTATPTAYASGGFPAPGPGNIPNYATGWGEINALAAVVKVGCPSGNTSIPCLQISPQAYNALVAEGGSTLVSLGLKNTGGSPLSYQVAVLHHPDDKIKVLLLSPDEDISDLKAALDPFPSLQVSIFPRSNLPGLTTTQLLAYEVVVVTNNFKWSDAGADMNTIGNRLADYIDAGGKVVVANFAYDWDEWDLGGRFMSGNYGPFTRSVQPDISGYHSLGTVYQPSHPVLSGITNLNSGSLKQKVGIAAGAAWLADWNTAPALPMVAVKPNVVGLNVLLSFGDGSHNWSGQWPALLNNSIHWLLNRPTGGDLTWVSLIAPSGSIPAQQEILIPVTLTAKPGFLSGQVRRALLQVTIPGMDPVNIPIVMNVVKEVRTVMLPFVRR